MLIEIKSRVYPDKVLHTIYKFSDDDQDTVHRTNITSDDKFLQVAHIYLPKSGHIFRPHFHKYQVKQTTITQESWVVIRGKIHAILYDVDMQILEKVELRAGDLCITFSGGHGYKVLEDNTRVIEFKTGPYFGQEKDKEFIKDKYYDDAMLYLGK